MSGYTATVIRVEGESGAHAVVTQADDVIHVADELMAHARDADRERMVGDIETYGDRIAFGTPGEGLGRLTYRRVGRADLYGWTIYRRETTA